MSFELLVESLYTTNRRPIRRDGLAADLTAVATVNIFQVAGGDIVLNGIHGKVTTVIGAAVGTTIQLNHTPTAGAAQVLCLASAAITNGAVNTIYTITGAVGVAMTVGLIGVGVYELTNRLVLVPGIIGLVVAVLANTGVIDWTLDYTPLTPAATITVL